MKLAIVPDCHLNRSVYKGVMDREYFDLPFRSADFMRSFKWIVDECINNLHPDLFIIPGDVYENFEPSNLITGFLSSQLRKLMNAKIPVIILVGNHDVCRKHHALKSLKELDLKGVKVIEQPKILEHTEFGVKFLLFPYSMDIEQNKISIKDAFNKFVKEIKEKDNGMPSIFFGHFGVRGGTLNEYEDGDEDGILDGILTDTTTTKDKKAYVNLNPKDIGLDDLDSIGAEYVFLGDYHRFQVLPTKKCIAMYPGSIEKSDLTEVDQKKGFVLYDSEAKPQGNMGKCQFIEYPHCRPMKELRGNIDQIRKQFLDIDASKYRESIIKITFEGNSDELFAFSTGLENLKKQIKEKINPIHLFHVQKTIDTDMEKAAGKIEQEIMAKGHMADEDVIEVVKEMLVETIKDQEECQKTVDLAVEIYREE